ncbi:DNA (cytosine-5)-methyltransferase 1 [Luteibacter sp. UNC138MFCol5.1]|uniref:DNA cytosine methyltransferase n=1 Tax=Luteibacter sp. UNC138MFCol5.1 TaxID=1502774 RepID=UPI0008C3C582|nr:DNA (cytosine-5-)-methyltransferase [Luteibacter sp. UNC138MFCol5.1]SEO64138.1 DNA (cytosine-5)-methyltransferase 1 [Luteibacter sp. UNC138MFCol5.1]
MADGSHHIPIAKKPLTGALDVGDLFAGLGGFSEGARAAGCNVVYAANHWPAAVAVHAANHPETTHACQDLQQTNFALLPHLDLLLASPACQGHSRARGKERPHHDSLRSTAWAVVAALEAKKPYAFVVENVKEFVKWAMFEAWKAAIEALGYSISIYFIDAADHGVPQHRVRVFIVGTRSANSIQLRLPRREHVPASTFIDFGAGRWSPIEKPGRAEKTLTRVLAGRAAHGDRFLTAYFGNEWGGRSIHRPIGTVTTRDRYAVVDGDRMRMLTAEEYRHAMGFPSDYQLPKNHRDAVHMLGNAVCPRVATDVINAIRQAA